MLKLSFFKPRFNPISKVFLKNSFFYQRFLIKNLPHTPLIGVKGGLTTIMFYKFIRIRTVLLYTLPNYWFITGSIFYKKFKFHKASRLRLISFMSRWFCIYFNITVDFVFRSDLNSFFYPNNNLNYRFFKNVCFVKNRKYRRIKKWLYKSRLKLNLSDVDMILGKKFF